MRINHMTAALTVAVSLHAAASVQVQKGTKPGIVNYSRVDATIGCGGATAIEAMPALKQEGFKTVVNLRHANEPGVDITAAETAATAAGLKYVHIPITGQSPEPEQVEKFLTVIADAANAPVYIHCGTANRVGAVWLIKRVLVDGWEIDRATAEAEAIGLTSPTLKAFALEYIAKGEARRTPK
jgi:uncharacterized protein (TIGR01244 family)